MASLLDVLKQNIKGKMVNTNPVFNVNQNQSRADQPVQKPVAQTAPKIPMLSLNVPTANANSTQEIAPIKSKLVQAQEAAAKAKLKSDILNSPAGIAIATMSLQNLVPAAVKTIKDILQGTAKSGGSVGITAANKTVIPLLKLPQQSEINLDKKTAEGKIQRVIFGDEPVKSLGKRIKEFPEKAKQLGISEKISKPVAAPIILGLTAMDFTGLGGEKSVIRILAKAGDAAEVGNVLRKIGVGEDLVKEYAPVIAKISDEKEVAKAIGSIEKIQKSTKAIETAPKIAPLAQDSAKIVPVVAKATNEAVGTAGKSEQGIKSAEPAKVTMADFMAGKNKTVEQIIAEGTAGKNVPVKSVINKAAGINPVVEKIIKPENILLKNQLRAEVRGSKSGFKAGYAEARESIVNQLRNTFGTKIADTKRTGELNLLKERIISRDHDRVKGEIVDYVKQNVGTKEQGKFISMAKNARTQKDLTKAFLRVDTFVQDFNLKKSINELKTKISKLSENTSIDIGYAQKIKDVVAGFELKGHNDKTYEKLLATQKFIQDQKAAGKDVAMPDRILEKLNILNRIPKDQLTAAQVEGLNNEVDLLAHLGATKLRTRQAIYGYEKAYRSDQLAQTAINVSPKEIIKPGIGESLSLKENSINALRTAFNEFDKKNITLAPIDGLAKITGMDPMKAAIDLDYANYLNHELKTTIIDARQKLIDKFKLNDKNMERIGVYAVARQDGGYDKLANMGIDQAAADAIKLSPGEIEYYDFVRKTFDDSYPAVKSYMKDVYNKDVGQVENYVSYITDFDAMSDLEVFDRFGTLADEALRTKTVNQGFTKSRVGAGTQKIQLNIDKIFLRHTDDVAYMTTMGKDIKMFSEIVNSPDMVEKMGQTSNLMWKEWLDLMARKGGTDGAKRIAALDFVRRNLGAAMFPFKVSSAVVQLTSFADGASVLGGDYMFKGAANIATSKEWRQFIWNNFPEIRAAVGDDPAFIELGETWLGKSKMGRIGMEPMKRMDGMVRTSTAAGAYEKLAKEAGKAVDLANPDKTIIQQAQNLVRKSQGSSIYKDQPLAITKGMFTGNKSIDKTIFQFQSFMLNRWDLIKDQIWREGFESKDYKQAISGMFWLIAVAGSVEIGLRGGANQFLSFITNSDNQDTKSFADKMAANTFNNVPVFGSIANSVAYGSNPVPIINVGENVLAGVASVWNGKKIDTKLRGVVKAAGNVGLLAGVPGSAQAMDLVKRVLTPASGSSAGNTKNSVNKFTELKKAQQKSNVTNAFTELKKSRAKK